MKQTKFVPIVTRRDADGQAALPVYLQGRLYIDFSDPNRFDESYDKLVRIIWDAPKDVKPSLGSPPPFVLSARRTEPLLFYSRRDDAVEEILADIGRAQESLRIYCRVYYSELVRRVGFEQAIATAVVSRPSGARALLVRQVTTDPNNEDAVRRLYEVEDPRLARWRDMHEYQLHLRSNAIDRSETIYKRVCELLDPGRRAEIRFEYAFYLNYLSPYSFVLIDGKVLYASFHTLNEGLRFGRDMPTVRIVPHTPLASAWFNRFHEEINFIEQHNISREIVAGSTS